MPTGDAVTEELKRFQGTWKQIACEKDGVTEALDEFGFEPMTTFLGDAYVVTLADGTVAIEGTFKIDPTREPKTVDWMDTFGEDAGKAFPAIYCLEGDRLVFCAADEGRERPTEFRTRPGQVLRVCQRVRT
jgi:uncharacterized protein (TIGR03067 family)